MISSHELDRQELLLQKKTRQHEAIYLEIIKLAKQGNHDGIEQINEERYSVNLQIVSNNKILQDISKIKSLPCNILISPIALLALEEEDAAVELLLAHGGNINDALIMYAYLGNEERIKFCLDHGANIASSIAGYIFKGDVRKAAEILEKNPFKMGFSPHKEVITSLAQKNESSATDNKWFIKYTVDLSDITPHAGSALLGYAFGNHDASVNNLLKKCPELRSFAVQGYCMIGEYDKARVLCHDENDYTEMAQILSWRGEFSRFREFFPKVEVTENILSAATFGAACAGRTQDVENLIKQNFSCLQSAARGSALGYHFPLVNHLLEQGANPKSVARALVDAGTLQNPTLARYTLSHIRNPEIAKKIISHMELPYHWAINSLVTIIRSKERNRAINYDPNNTSTPLYQFKLQQKRLPYHLSPRLFDIWFKKSKEFRDGVSFWFLDANKIMEATKIPFEIYIYITSYILGCSNKDAKKIYENVSTVHEKIIQAGRDNLFNSLKKNVDSGINSVKNKLASILPGNKR